MGQKKKRKLKKGIIKKIASYAFTTISLIIIIIAVLSLLFINKDDRNLFGYSAYIVNSDSMSKTDFDAGDLIIIKKVDVNTLSMGDIITFYSNDPKSYNEIITHKIRKITTDDKNRLLFTTYGTTTDVDDSYPISENNIIGKYQFKISNLGYLFSLRQSVLGYIVFLVIPFSIIIFLQSKNCVKHYKKYQNSKNKEKDEEFQKKLDKLEEEKRQLEAENKRMKENYKNHE